jgi:hypothetical protein
MRRSISVCSRQIRGRADEVPIRPIQKIAQAGSLGVITLFMACSGWAQTAQQGLQISGQVQLQADARGSNADSPLAQANQLAPGTSAPPGNGATLETLLRSSGRGWSASASFLQQTQQNMPQQNRAWLNELVATHDAGSWQFSAGKKIVAWDVGYAFRPNDVVQQEERRTLISTLAEGRPLLMVEHFDADTAWSWVWVNPTKSASQTGAKEPALAARVYQRHGSVDWHGFARVGAHTGASLGAALAWVASDALELHASARYLNRTDSLTIDPLATSLARADPWQAASVQHTGQALLGGTWTNESRVSLLAEAWWDGTALSDNEWERWLKRNALLADLPVLGAPASAAAGNLAWQANALNVSGSLRRSNLYLRLSWDVDAWQPSLDMLYQPADSGRIVTAALLWKGDRMQVQGGWRVYGGSTASVLRQLPTHSQGYVAATWMF